MILPSHSTKRYNPVGVCIYCGSKENLTKEHIVPYSAGGRWILPSSSCKPCARITGKFEGEFSRTVLGPLRMLFNLPTRRPNERPRHLPLKVKYANSVDWEIIHVDRSICPFLVVLPLYPSPNPALAPETNKNGAATTKFWIRGGGFRENRDEHLEMLCRLAGASQVMPDGTVNANVVCRTLAKIAHSFTVAELGIDGFQPLLCTLIRTENQSECPLYIGGGGSNEAPSTNLHDVAFTRDSATGDYVSVDVRFLGVLGTPTYSVVVGRKK